MKKEEKREREKYPSFFFSSFSSKKYLFPLGKLHYIFYPFSMIVSITIITLLHAERGNSSQDQK